VRLPRAQRIWLSSVMNTPLISRQIQMSHASDLVAVCFPSSVGIEFDNVLKFPSC